MNSKLTDILRKYGIETFELKESPELFRYILRTVPELPTEGQIEVLQVIPAITEIKFESLTEPEKRYSLAGVATEDIRAGDRVEVCFEKGLLRRERQE
jgi:hypothetical protein